MVNKFFRLMLRFNIEYMPRFICAYICWNVNKYEIRSDEQEKKTLVLKDDKANWYGRRGILILIWRELEDDGQSRRYMMEGDDCSSDVVVNQDFNDQVSLNLREPRDLTKWRKCTFREGVDPIYRWRGKGSEFQKQL